MAVNKKPKSKLNAKLLQESYPSRPRKSVTFWAFVFLIFTGVAFALAFGFTMMNYCVELFNGLISENPFESGTPFGEYLYGSGLWLVACAVLVLDLFPFILICKVGKWRKAHKWFLVFLIPILILGVVAGVIDSVPALKNLFMTDGNPSDILVIIDMVFWYAVVVYPFLVFFFDFLLLFYNKCHPGGKFAYIYKLRRLRIKEAETSKDRRRIKKEFYRNYAKKQWREMMILLLGDSIVVGGKNQLDYDGYLFLLEDAVEADKFLTEAEFEILYDSCKFEDIKRLRVELVEDADRIKRGRGKPLSEDPDRYQGIVKRKRGRIDPLKAKETPQPRDAAPLPTDQEKKAAPVPEAKPKEE